MSVRKVLVAASASLAGLLVLACVGSSAWAQGQEVLLCYISATSVPKASSTVVSCSTPDITFGTGGTIPAGQDLNVQYVDSEAQTNNSSLVINSIETTLNVNNGATNLEFMDVAFTPYANVAGGGGTSPSLTNPASFGGVNSPNIDLLEETLSNWPNASGGDNVTFQLQVFVTNTSSSTAYSVQGALHVVVAYNTL